MSYSLTRKALDLFKDDFTVEKVQKKKKKLKPVKERISTNRIGVKKAINKLKKVEKKKITKNLIRNIHDDKDYYKKHDYTEENLDRITRLSSVANVNEGTLRIILDHNRGRMARDRKEKVKSLEDEPVITDEDFERFEREYVFNKQT